MVVVFGTICIDSVRFVPNLPSQGGYVEVQRENLFLGGEAANTARHLLAWGVPVSLAGNGLGWGEEGLKLMQLVVDAGLPADLLVADRGETPVCDIYVTPDGDRTMFGRGFSAMDWAESAQTFPLLKDQWFTAEPNMPETSRIAARRAIDAGMKTYLMDFVRENEPVAPGSFWQASTDWAGVKGDRQTNLQVVSHNAEQYGCHAILTDGAEGLFYASPTCPAVWLPAFPCTRIVDSTGAGDAFRAGMLRNLHEGAGIADALAFAAAAGSLACGLAGAAEHVPALAEVAAIMKAHPKIVQKYRSTVGAG